jgi:DNA-binding transcriptional ArsR family regulator
MSKIQSCLSIDELSQEQADRCGVFGSARRVLILWALVDGELSVGAIAETVGSTIQNVSQHLSLMRERDIVVSRRDAQTIYYSLNEKTVTDHCMNLLQRNRFRSIGED